MTDGVVFSLCAAAIVGIGVYGFTAHRNLVRRILAFNLIGSGIFLLFGGLTQTTGIGADPVPQAMVITGIVVALAATALAVTLTVRLFETTGRAVMPEEAPPEGTAAPPRAAGASGGRGSTAVDDVGRV